MAETFNHTSQLRSRAAFLPPAALLAVGFAVLLAIVLMTYLLAERSKTHFDQAISARDQRTAAVELRNALLAAESSHRGFIYSGNEVYLAPFETASRQALRWLDALDRSVVIDPEAMKLVQRLRAISAEKMEALEESIALKRDRRDAEVMSSFRLSRDKALMDEANIFFSGLILAADDRMTEGVMEQRSNATWLRWITIVGGVIIVTVVAFGIFSVVRHGHALAAAHRDLAALNADLEARIVARTADLAQANDEIQRFAYIVTHDLRAPLVNIMGFTGELEMGIRKLVSAVEASSGAGLPVEVMREARLAAAEDLPEAIRFIRSSTTTMDDLIKAILRLAREGRRTLRAESIDLEQALKSSAAAMQHQIQQNGGAITFYTTLATIEIDRLALEQIVSNLLDNAVKYRSRDRPLAISVRALAMHQDRFTLEVIDNGRGIAAQDMNRIFEPFRRTGLLDQPGEGMGLAFVKALVRRLGGYITVRSELGHGTTFTVVLPTKQVEGKPVAT